MKKLTSLLLWLLLAVIAIGAASCAGPAHAAGPYVSPSQMRQNALAGAFTRKSPCQQGVGDNCGSEPPEWHADPTQCGIVFSSSSARNESFSYAQAGTGSKTAFGFFFPYNNSSHLEVLVGGVLKTQGTDYTVSSPGNTGTVTFTVAPPNGSNNVVVRLKTLWNGDGATTTFPYNFKIKYIESLEVKVGGVLKTYGTDYTIAGINSSTGGSVTFTAAPAVGTANVSVAMVSISTKGFLLTVPTAAEFAASGFAAGGASAAGTGIANREGQCRIGIIPAAPAPFNYARIGIKNGVLGNDKFTNIWDGGPSIDMYDGDIPFPESWGIVWYAWNGTSFLYDGSSAAQGQRVGMGQTAMHGQGRLFVVTQDYPWEKPDMPSKIGNLAYCPFNGRGLNTNANDHPTLALMPVGCVFYAPTGGSSTDYIQIAQTTGAFATNVTQGAAYAAGTSPDGQPYPAGNYAVIVMQAAVTTIISGDTMFVVSLPMTNGSKVNGRWRVKRLVPGTDPGCAGGSPACLELHEEVQDWDQNKVWGVGPPSNFLPGDTMKNAGTVACCMAHTLGTVSLANGRRTDPVMGSELVGSVLAPEGTIVGVAAAVSNVITDSGSTRNVASFFNPVEKKCEVTLSADKSTASAVYVEMDPTRRCNFVFTDAGSTRARALGDLGRRVRHTASVGVSNNTAGGGCDIGIAYDSNTPEEAVPPGMVNPTGVTGGMVNLSLFGNKSGLAEGTHNGRLVWRTNGTGTCTAKAASSAYQFWIPQ